MAHGLYQANNEELRIYAILVDILNENGTPQIEKTKSLMQSDYHGVARWKIGPLRFGHPLFQGRLQGTLRRSYLFQGHLYQQ